MPNFTPNLNLKKPLTTEYYNIADFNDNMDLIDVLPQDIIDAQPKEEYSETVVESITSSYTVWSTAHTHTVSNNGTYIASCNSFLSKIGGNGINVKFVKNDTTIINEIIFPPANSGIFETFQKLSLVTGDTLKIMFKAHLATQEVRVKDCRVYLKEYKGS